MSVSSKAVGSSLRSLPSTPEVDETAAELRHERWAHLHVNWTAAWTGALASFCAVLVFGLVGIALGAHVVGPEHRVVDLSRIGFWTLIFSTCSAFFAFAIGGWIAGKVAGILHAEPAMLHGAIAWLVSVPILVAAAGLGAGSSYGGWYAGVTGNPTWSVPGGAPFARPEPLPPNPTSDELAEYRTQRAQYQHNVQTWNEETPRAVRNTALGAITALLLGLVGSVIGGWVAAGEPMNFSHFRTRRPIYHQAL